MFTSLRSATNFRTPRSTLGIARPGLFFPLCLIGELCHISRLYMLYLYGLTCQSTTPLPLATSIMVHQKVDASVLLPCCFHPDTKQHQFSNDRFAWDEKENYQRIATDFTSHFLGCAELIIHPACIKLSFFFRKLPNVDDDHFQVSRNTVPCDRDEANFPSDALQSCPLRPDRSMQEVPCRQNSAIRSALPIPRDEEEGARTRHGAARLRRVQPNLGEELGRLDRICQ
jgi:hypothetical protein